MKRNLLRRLNEARKTIGTVTREAPKTKKEQENEIHEAILQSLLPQYNMTMELTGKRGVLMNPHHHTIGEVVRFLSAGTINKPHHIMVYRPRTEVVGENIEMDASIVMDMPCAILFVPEDDPTRIGAQMEDSLADAIEHSPELSDANIFTTLLEHDDESDIDRIFIKIYDPEDYPELDPSGVKPEE